MLTKEEQEYKEDLLSEIQNVRETLESTEKFLCEGSERDDIIGVGGLMLFVAYEALTGLMKNLQTFARQYLKNTPSEPKDVESEEEKA